MAKPIIKLGPHERIAAVVPEFCVGPGWSNAPLWVHIHDQQAKTFRTECLQPDEQTREAMLLFRPLEVMQHAMRGAIEPLVKKEKKRG